MHVPIHLANDNLFKPIRQLGLTYADTTAFAVGGGRLAFTVIVVRLRLLDIGNRKMLNPEDIAAEIRRFLYIGDQKMLYPHDIAADIVMQFAIVVRIFPIRGRRREGGRRFRLVLVATFKYHAATADVW